jgi:hypothetical protein
VQESDGILTVREVHENNLAKRTGWKQFNKLKGGSVAVQISVGVVNLAKRVYVM